MKRFTLNRFLRLWSGRTLAILGCVLAACTTPSDGPSAATTAGVAGPHEITPAGAPLADYVGRYAPRALEAEGVLSVELRQGVLTAGPSFWRPARNLVPVGRDSFRVENFLDRIQVFGRDSSGRVVSVTCHKLGFEGTLIREADGDSLPVEWLARGQGRRAAEALLAGGAPLPTLAAISRRALFVPSLAAADAEFLEALTMQRPDDAALATELGYAFVALERRDDARMQFARAMALDSTATAARDALWRLGDTRAAPPDTGWRLPFALGALFAPPTAAERARVRADWAARDLRPGGVRAIHRDRIPLGGGTATLRLVAYRVHGALSYGAIVVPDHAAHHGCPVILEAKGVSWNYLPLELPHDLQTPAMLGRDADRFVYVVPGYRGEVIRLNGVTMRAEGDRSDAWDGATDDALALLNVALATTPEADGSRIGVFGRSRGGAVALLAAERDPRIRAVVAWAAPTDWFSLMGQGGWTLQEVAADGLAHKAKPDQPGGQFIDHFLTAAIAGRATLADTRRRLLAASALWFADRLPWTQVHYGMDDAIVPSRNGAGLEDRVGRTPCFHAFYHPDAGHDQDLFDAPRETREAFLHLLAGDLPACAVPRDDRRIDGTR